MNDFELESHIESCGLLMMSAMESFYLTGNDAFRADASNWLHLMEQAIRSRRSTKIASMEAELGLY